MPEAYPAYSAPVTVPDRVWFAPAISDVPDVYPCKLSFEEAGFAFWKCPSGWGGFSVCTLWLKGDITDAAMPINVRIDAGTCNEVFTTHNENHDLTPALVINEYECIDLTTTFATVLAAITACDLVQFKVVNNDDTNDLRYMGIEIVEA